ncbi:hypothetical protein [Paraburkholderia diazotrophica]|uniref:hypothetical protein n=1 Tax=Paraburkholderia diazotrophica TaxID=667676 RepID=UPI00317E0C2B
MCAWQLSTSSELSGLRRTVTDHSRKRSNEGYERARHIVDQHMLGRCTRRERIALDMRCEDESPVQKLVAVTILWLAHDASADINAAGRSPCVDAATSRSALWCRRYSRANAIASGVRPTGGVV